ncbi:MAG: hypothetical protein JNM98_06245 [Rhodocyclaceae bacterium]|nr:hypothetical protein [Rhodocyclaceae bacterium]
MRPADCIVRTARRAMLRVRLAYLEWRARELQDTAARIEFHARCMMGDAAALRSRACELLLARSIERGAP